MCLRLGARHPSLDQATIMAWCNITQKAADLVQGKNQTPGAGAFWVGMEVQGGPGRAAGRGAGGNCDCQGCRQQWGAQSLAWSLQVKPGQSQQRFRLILTPHF